MKDSIVLGVILALSAFSAQAQDAKGGQVLAESSTVQKATEQKKTPLKLPTPKAEILGHPVVYGGYLTDLNRAENNRAMLSLRAPVDPTRDVENLWYYPGTDKVQGVVLFRVKF